ncbi:serine hydrolase-like protein [Watersipora subatra]|uniref:serine hydrolase-like protein n=1 Tax=Watersipora subatra TaxID=2589382 RepID=UPI00355C710F
MVFKMAKEVLIKVGYGNIAYKVWGDNSPSAQKFLGVHGWLDNAGSFDPLMPYFQNQGRCVACLDLPGHGLSSHHPQGIPYSHASDIQAMRSVIKDLGWQNYHLLGHSMGAMRSQMYALCWASEVISVLNLDAVIMPIEHISPGKTPFEALGKQVDKYLGYRDTYHGKAREHTWDELAQRWLAAVPDLGLDNFTVLMERGSTKLANGMYVFNRDPALHNRTNAVLGHSTKEIFSCMQKLGHIPQIVLSSSNFGSFTKDCPELADTVDKFLHALSEIYPNKMEIINVGGSHHFHMHTPKETSDILNKFLAHVPHNDSS